MSINVGDATRLLLLALALVAAWPANSADLDCSRFTEDAARNRSSNPCANRECHLPSILLGGLASRFLKRRHRDSIAFGEASARVSQDLITQDPVRPTRPRRSAYASRPHSFAKPSGSSPEAGLRCGPSERSFSVWAIIANPSNRFSARTRSTRLSPMSRAKRVWPPLTAGTMTRQRVYSRPHFELPRTTGASTRNLRSPTCSRADWKTRALMLKWQSSKGHPTRCRPTSCASFAMSRQARGHSRRAPRRSDRRREPTTRSVVSTLLVAARSKTSE
jgi:hypothetical protein